MCGSWMRAAAAAIRSKEVGGSELLEVYLDRIDRHNPRLNAVVTMDVDGARHAAWRLTML